MVRRNRVRRSRHILPTAAIVGGGLFGVLSLSAWLHVQSVRLSYQAQAIRQELEQLDRLEHAERRRLEAALSLSRLDITVRARGGLFLPRPDQIRILPETT
jgi:hypothetical protein